METCQPYGCSLVMAFGFLLGTVLIACAGIVTYWLRRLSAWLHERHTQHLLRSVDEAFPTWCNVVTTRRYNDWLRSQPSETQNLAASMRPQDAIEVLRRYEALK